MAFLKAFPPEPRLYFVMPISIFVSFVCCASAELTTEGTALSQEKFTANSWRKGLRFNESDLPHWTELNLEVYKGEDVR